MSYRSFLFLATAGIAIAQSGSGCENLTDVTELLQAEDGNMYCSSILDLGTVTNTIVESTTVFDTSTITTQSEVTLTTTSTETDTISSGTVTETAPLFLTTTTLFETTTTYACGLPPIRRDLGGQLVPYNEAKATSIPQPTPSLEEWDDEECDEEDEDEEPETAPVAYTAHSMELSAVYPASAPAGYASSSSTYAQMSSYPAHSTASNYAKYPQASGNASIHYPSGTISSSHSRPTVSSDDWHSQVTGNSTTYHPRGVISSSHILSTSSTNSTTLIVTPTPTPAPKLSCDSAPTALRTGYPCEAVSEACGCLGLAPATEDSTSTTTITEAVYTTETMLITTVTELTETIFLTVPAATSTETPTSTITENILVTATSCPCSGSTSSLCGTTPDTCKDLRTDTSNCGSCGITCGSDESCSAGKCVAPPAVPNVPSCAGSACGKFIRCGTGNNCVCATTPEGSGVCIQGGACSSYQRCTASSDCGAEEKCAINTCCSYGICIRAQDNCPNMGSAKRMFRRRTWDGGETSTGEGL